MYRNLAVFLVLVIDVVVVLSASVDPNAKIVTVHDPSHQFLDEFGRSRWFHGTNAVVKGPPWYPLTGGPEVCNHSMGYAMCDADMDLLQELGVNVIRLGVMWPGAEPQRGQYDAEYFQAIHGVIQKLASRGIYTLIDVHQDVFSGQFCGAGIPDWTVDPEWVANPNFRFPYPLLPDPFETDENGIPIEGECGKIKNWFMMYLTVGVGNAFQQLYDNVDNLGDSFADYWKKLAEEYGHYGSVLGFDLMNEPWAGNIFTNPLLLVPGVADKRNLEQLWDKCNDKIRQVDNTTLVFFEGVTFDILHGFSNVPGGDGSKTALSWHYYTPPSLGLSTVFRNRAADQDRLQTGAMLTEFRMWSGDDTVSKEMRDSLDLADSHLQSWMGWEYTHIFSQKEEELERHYARTYAPAVAGLVKKMGFYEDTSYFFITWTINTNISAPTEIKINKRLYYPNGFTLIVRPTDATTWEAIDNQNIHVKYTANATNGEDITIEIVNGEVITDTSATSRLSFGFQFLLLVAFVINAV